MLLEKRYRMGRIQQREKLIKYKILIGIIVLIFVMIWAFYMFAQLPYREAKSEAFQMAAKYARVDNINNFYIYNGQKTYYTIEGDNSSNQDVYVIIPQKGNRINIYDQNKGITKSTANQIVNQKYHPQRIIKTVFGMSSGHIPFWEVAYDNQQGNLCYAHVAFKDGRILRSITNM